MAKDGGKKRSCMCHLTSNFESDQIQTACVGGAMGWYVFLNGFKYNSARSQTRMFILFLSILLFGLWLAMLMILIKINCIKELDGLLVAFVFVHLESFNWMLPSNLHDAQTLFWTL